MPERPLTCLVKYSIHDVHKFTTRASESIDENTLKRSIKYKQTKRGRSIFDAVWGRNVVLHI